VPGYFAPGLMRVVLFWRAFGVESRNVFHVKGPPGVDLPTLTAVADVFRSWDFLAWAGFRSVDHLFYRSTARSLETAMSALVAERRFSQFGAIPGFAFKMLPSPQAPVAEWFTADGQFGRPRSYLSGITAAATTAVEDTTVLNDAYCVGLDGALADLLLTLADLGPFRMVHLRTEKSGGTRVLQRISDVVGVRVNRHWTGTQVRRSHLRRGAR
jgi:hypothetical protein